MRSILEELWYGNIIPTEHSVGRNKSIKGLLNLMSKNRDALETTLTESQKELLTKYDDVVNEMYGNIEKEAFFYGFSLGGRIILEVLTDHITD